MKDIKVCLKVTPDRQVGNSKVNNRTAAVVICDLWENGFVPTAQRSVC